MARALFSIHLAIGIGVPLALVALLTFVYSRAADMKLPNRDYWLAPERIAETRDLLVAHGIWFGYAADQLVCYVHWLELKAHRSAPPHLPDRAGAMRRPDPVLPHRRRLVRSVAAGFRRAARTA